MRTYFFAALLAILFIACEDSPSKEPTTPKAAATNSLIKTWTCGAETVIDKGTDKVFENSGDKFLNGEVQTREHARTGVFGIRLDENSSYGMTFFLPELLPGDMIRISAWRKINGNTAGTLTIQSDRSGMMISANTSIAEEDGWELINGMVFIEENYVANDLKCFLFNPSSGPVFFDDFVVELHRSYQFPEFEDPAIELLLSADKMRKLRLKREKAMELGVLLSEDDDWVPGQFIYNGDTLKMEARLKGDWTDHLQGEKWSFRIKVKGGSFQGLRSFSLHTPAARNFLDEWVIHKLFEEHDVLTPRYSFAPVNLNGKSLGVYAVEEHFDKQLVESKKRREGPLLKLDEDAAFQITAQSKEAGSTYDQPLVAELSEIQPFKFGKTKKTPGLRNLFIEGQKLLYQHQHNLTKASELYDIEKLARMYVIADLAGSHHGLGWHNQRFYMNPVTCRLEPVAYDYFTNWSETHKVVINGSSAIEEGSEHGDFFRLMPFQDSDFVAAYLTSFNEMADLENLNQFLNKHQEEIAAIEAMLGAEFSGYNFNETAWKRGWQHSADQLTDFEAEYSVRPIPFRKGISMKWEGGTLVNNPVPAQSIKVYLNDTVNGEFDVDIINTFLEPVELIGFGTKVSMVDPLSNPKSLEPHYKGQRSYGFKTPYEYSYYQVPGSDEVHQKQMLPWPLPTGKTPRQNLKASIPAAFKKSGKKLTLSGNKTISTNTFIPAGYEVIVEAGASVNLNNCFFISASAVKFNGTAENPVVVRGTNAQGFTVLQADSRSKVSHTTFDGFNTLLIPGWTLTGAVNFYESDVDLDHTTLTNNICEDGLNIIRSDFSLIDSEVSNTFSDGFDADFCTGLVQRSKFLNSGNDCIDFSTSEIEIVDCVINEAGDKGISGGEHSTLTVRNVKIDGANIGIAAKDLTHIEIEQSSISNCRFGYAIYQKKPEFGPATIFGSSITTTAIDTLHLIETGSELRIDGKALEGDRFIDLDKLYDV